MKKVLKIVGMILGGLLGIILCIAAWVAFTGVPTYEPKSIAVQIPTDSAALHVGKVIVEERCAFCHYGADGKLSGRQFTSADEPFGEFWSKNITKDKEHGIGAYSDGQLAYLLRTGINRHGYYIGPWMSSVLLSDQDLGAVIAYLRSDSPLVAPSQATHPGTEPNFLVKALLKFGAFAPLTYDGRPVTAPAPSKSAEFGKYLITARYNCFECHSANFESNDQYVPEKSVGYLAGGNLVRDNQFKIIPSANITMSPTTGIGTWSYEQFNHALRTGERPDGKVLSAAMPRMSMLDEVEIQALWAYLQTVPVIEHSVAR